MKLSNDQAFNLLNSIEALSSDIKLPTKTAYALLKNKNKLTSAVNKFFKSRESIIHSFSKKDKDGNVIIEKHVINQKDIDEAIAAGNEPPNPNEIERYAIENREENEAMMSQQIEKLISEDIGVSLHKIPVEGLEETIAEQKSVSLKELDRILSAIELINEFC